MKKRILLGLTLLLAAAEIANCETIRVLADGTGDYPTIQAAIDAASNGDTVIVGPGTYTGPGNRNINFKRKAITVRSENGPKNCIIDCEYASRAFTFDSRETNKSTLDGFTITRGYSARGGAIYCNNSRPKVVNCVFRNNRAYRSGDFGGDGGAIYARRCSGLMLSNCAFIANSADRYGGGIFASIDSILTVTNCTLAWNSAGKPGIYATGGGMFNGQRTSSNLINCIFWGNSATYHGGRQLSIANNCNMWVDFCNIQGGNSPVALYVYKSSVNWGIGNVVTNPLLVSNDYHLSAGSPCINAGDPAFVSQPDETDIDGEPRVLAGRVDMGVDEFTKEPAILVALEIVGPNEVVENSSAQYTAIAYYDLGYKAEVTTSAVWLLESDAYATINHYGRLTTGRIEIPETITIYAQYTDNRVTVDAEITVQVSPLVDLQITGPQAVRVNHQEQYNLIAYYGNGHTSDVTDSALWWVEPQAIANIEAGLLWTEEIDERRDITIYAQYTSGGVTLEMEMTIQGFPPSPYTFYVPAYFQTIQEAINFAEDSDTVIVADGTYTGDGNRDLDFLGKAITVRSENGPDNCIIDCQGTKDDQHGGFYFQKDEDMSSILDGFTIINGYAWQGGGIFCHNSNPTITNCIIVNNTAVDQGGGIFCYESSPTITNCTISDNSAYYRGGGIYCESSSPLITNCTFGGNSVTWRGGRGGGIAFRDSNSKIKNCKIIANYSEDAGGGIYCGFMSSPEIINCTISGNSAMRGGGVSYSHDPTPDLWNTSPKITNCTITNNSAKQQGGGIYSGSSTSPVISNCIITGNSAEYYGGGMSNWNSNPMVTNCTFAGNSASYGNALSCDSWRYPSNVQMMNCILADGGNEIWNSDGSTTTITYSDVQGGWPGEGNIDEDPCFVEVGYWDMDDVWVEGDYHLLAGSPCIDAGDNTSVPADTTDLDGDGNTTEPIPFDLDGNPRIMDGDNDGNPVVDMGAFEVLSLLELIEEAIIEKAEALQKINAALEKELEAYETLGEILESGDYGDWNREAVLGARWKISIAMFYEEDYIKKVLEKNIDKLQRSLSVLGIEPGQGSNSYMAESNAGAYEAAVLSLHELVINLLEEAITEKAEALQRIDAALQKERQAYELLEQMLINRDYGDWNRQDILRAKSRIYVAIKYEEYLKKVLMIMTVEKLEDSLSRLAAQASQASH